VHSLGFESLKNERERDSLKEIRTEVRRDDREEDTERGEIFDGQGI
jgi:hypothetical protein